MSLNQQDNATIRQVLEKLAFYQFLQPSELEKLVGGFEKSDIGKGDTLITQDKTGEIFYILASGTVGVYLKGKLMDKKIATLGADSFFGEMSLISDEPRSATVVCEEDGVVYTLLKKTFREVIMSNPHISEMVRKTASERKASTKSIEHSEWMGKKL
jgi:CRP-like cAMP-binding protein